MKDIERVLVVGSGAVGTAIASIISEHIPGSVSVLADGERFERYNRDGFIVNGKTYHFPVISPVSTHSHYDLIIVAVKHHHLPEAIEQMKAHVGDNTSILSLMNGISSEEQLGARFGAGPGAPDGVRLPPYAMILGIDAVRIGNETRFASTGKIFFGEATNNTSALSPRIQRIAAFFEKACVPYEIPENMLRALWFKFMINVGINQASAILRAPYRLFQTNTNAKAVMETLQREVIALSQAMGINLNEQDLVNWEKTLAGLHPDNLTSMCQDVLANRKTEVEMFAGTVVHLGKQYQVPTPANELVFNLIKAIEASYNPTVIP
ncbi:ketopantoate reductase family protein [Gracilinema caldarium]|uniref:2-dehydropantoate 2-reductase n=1 Tax=Gracilinema caldarium (strain ATCC 51460 / DSM 7334 / H1) TaxID=744872 RepID=F8F2F6_GRAC1|nr:ketopantoate reductase family protein [Gracilinema caldarium]AEJ20938.1 2-dehydropantoate 2-reductase [Gracilinema caldarium DSM 7334]